jgi:hypothetical protein
MTLAKCSGHLPVYVCDLADVNTSSSKISGVSSMGSRVYVVSGSTCKAYIVASDCHIAEIINRIA